MSLLLAIESEYNLENKSILVSEDDINWGVGGNPDRADIEEAFIIVIKNVDSFNPWKTVDVTTDIKAGALDDYEILEDEVYEDDIYEVYLVMSTTGYTGDDPYEYYSLGNMLFLYYNLKSSISKFWVQYASISNIERKKGLYDICQWLEVNLSGLEGIANSPTSQPRKAKFVEVLELINRKINLNKNYLKL